MASPITRITPRTWGSADVYCREINVDGTVPSGSAFAYYARAIQGSFDWEEGTTTNAENIVNDAGGTGWDVGRGSTTSTNGKVVLKLTVFRNTVGELVDGFFTKTGRAKYYQFVVRYNDTENEDGEVEFAGFAVTKIRGNSTMPIPGHEFAAEFEVVMLSASNSINISTLSGTGLTMTGATIVVAANEGVGYTAVSA